MKTLLSVIGKILFSLLIVFAGIFLIGAVISIISYLGGSSMEDLEDIDIPGLMYIQFFLFIGASLLMYALFERKKGWSMGFRQQHAVRLTIHGALWGIAAITVCALIIWAGGGVSWSRASLDQDTILSLLSGILLFIGVSVSEEVFSRGYVQGLLRYHYGVIPSIIVTSLLFTFLHSFNPGMFDSPFPIINLALAGVILGIARELTGGLWWPIGLHLTWNYTQGYIFGFNVSGGDSDASVLHTVDHGPDWLSGGQFGIEGSLVSVIVLLLSIPIIYLVYGKKNKSFSKNTNHPIDTI